jgi:hypothetical protein
MKLPAIIVTAQVCSMPEVRPQKNLKQVMSCSMTAQFHSHSILTLPLRRRNTVASAFYCLAYIAGAPSCRSC